MGQLLVIDFDNNIVASELNWCNYKSKDLIKREIYTEFIKEYAIL